MAPRGREGKESAWVKKAPAGAAPADKVKEPENGEDREGVSKGREGGKGKGRKGERPRREPRGEEDGDGKSKGRGKGKHKKGAGAEAEGPNSDEEEMDEHAAAIMKMLRAGGPKIIRYEKGQLLSISRLAASNVKPELDPLIDKDNKDSVLLTRIATGREKHEEGKAGAQQGEEEGSRRRSKATGTGRDADVDREAAPAVELTEGDAAAAEEDEEGKQRAFEKWLGRNMPKLEAMSKATPSSGSTNWSSTLSAAALSAGKAGSSAGPSAAQAALLQQQALAGSLDGRNAAHAMQAAAYMQAMTQMQAAAAAARQSSYSQMPWNSYNAYMNPYMNAYGSGYGSLDPYAALQQQAAAANLSEAMQAKLAGQLNQLATSQAARNMATVVKAAAQAKLQAAKAVPKTPGGGGGPAAKAAAKASVPKSAPAPKVQALPKQRPAAPSAAGLVVPKKPSAPSPSPTPNAPAAAPAAASVPAEAPAPKAEAVPKSAPGEGEAEDEAGCSQS